MNVGDHDTYTRKSALPEATSAKVQGLAASAMNAAPTSSYFYFLMCGGLCPGLRRFLFLLVFMQLPYFPRSGYVTTEDHENKHHHCENDHCEIDAALERTVGLHCAQDIRSEVVLKDWMCLLSICCKVFAYVGKQEQIRDLLVIVVHVEAYGGMFGIFRKENCIYVCIVNKIIDENIVLRNTFCYVALAGDGFEILCVDVGEKGIIESTAECHCYVCYCAK